MLACCSALANASDVNVSHAKHNAFAVDAVASKCYVIHIPDAATVDVAVAVERSSVYLPKHVDFTPIFKCRVTLRNTKDV